MTQRIVLDLHKVSVECIAQRVGDGNGLLLLS